MPTDETTTGVPHFNGMNAKSFHREITQCDCPGCQHMCNAVRHVLQLPTEQQHLILELLGVAVAS